MNRELFIFNGSKHVFDSKHPLQYYKKIVYSKHENVINISLKIKMYRNIECPIVRR